MWVAAGVLQQNAQWLIVGMRKQWVFAMKWNTEECEQTDWKAPKWVSQGTIERDTGEQVVGVGARDPPLEDALLLDAQVERVEVLRAQQ